MPQNLKAMKGQAGTLFAFIDDDFIIQNIGIHYKMPMFCSAGPQVVVYGQDT